MLNYINKINRLMNAEPVTGANAKRRTAQFNVMSKNNNGRQH